MVAMGSPRFARSLVSTTHAVSLCWRLGTLSCLRTRPPDLADMLVARPLMVTMLLSTVPPVDCKWAAAASSPSWRSREVIVLSPFGFHAWNYVYPAVWGRASRARLSCCCSCWSVWVVELVVHYKS